MPTNIILYQTKLLWCALLSVCMVGKVIELRQWVSLLLMMVGISVVQLANHET